MLIKPSQNRKDYFTPRTLADIKYFSLKNKDQSLSKDSVNELLAKQTAVVATKKGTVESLATSDLSNASVAALLSHAEGLVIVPQSWQIDHSMATALSRASNNYLSLDHIPTIRSLIGKSTLTQNLNLTLDDLYRERCRQDSRADERFRPIASHIGFRWRGSDGQTRFFTYLSAVKALELRALQNIAYYKTVGQTLAQAAATGVHEFTGDELTTAQRNRRLKKSARYAGVTRAHETLIRKLDVTQDDLIQTDSATRGAFNAFKSWRYLVPSTADRTKKYHVHLNNLAAVHNPMHSLTVAKNFQSHCDCPAHTYRSDRLSQRTSYVKEADFICHHQIAALYSATQIVNRNPHTNKYEVLEIPVFIPLAPLVSAADTLRYRTLAAHTDGKRIRFEPLSDASVNAALSTLFASKPFESLATTQPSRMREKKRDIISYTLTYVE
ncbi:MAG TPA: hypothetical protein VK158_03870 [Acidobacteriota bacterium]|nr:hypothetical protein [Acidobacteriota bacterium]